MASRSRHPPRRLEPCGSGGGHFEFPPHSCLSLFTSLASCHSCGLLAVSPLAACPRVSTTSVPETLGFCIVSILRASGELPYHPACHSPPCRDVKLYTWTSCDAMSHHRSSIRCCHLFLVEYIFTVSHYPPFFFSFEFASGKWHRERGIE